MATDVQALLLKIDANTELARRELRKMDSDFDTFTRKSEEAAGSADKAFSGFGDAAKEAAAQIAAAFSVSAIASYLLDTTAAFQALKAQLEVATGSIENASIAFDALQKLAAETPFSVEQVVTAFIKLKNLGLDPSRAAIISYGNTAAALGKTLDDVVEAVADAAVGEFERLKEFGIKASAEGNKVAFTFKGVTTEVGKNAKEIERFLQNIGDTDFAGSLEKQSKTINGALSNLGDAADQLAVTITGIGFDDAFLRSLQTVSSALAGINAQVAGLRRIGADSGLAGLLGASGNDALNSSTASGRQGLLVQDVNRRFLALQQAERARDSGDFIDRNFGTGSATSLAQRRADLAVSERKLAEFERANAAELKREKDGRGAGDPLSAFGSATTVGDKNNNTKKKTGAKSSKPSLTPQQQRLNSSDFNAPVESITTGLASSSIFLNDIGARLADIEVQAVNLSNVELFDPESISAGTNFINDLSFGLTDALAGAASLGDVLTQTFERAGLALIQSGILNFLSGGAQGTSFASSLGSIGKLVSGLGFANGGSPPVGKFSMVGERGPELFMPRVPGTIIPNHMLGGGGATVQQFDLRGAVVTEQLYAQMQAIGAKAAQAGAIGGAQLAGANSARRARRTAR